MMTTVERRLAAILAADIVGYSRLMGRDEAGTLARVKRFIAELLKPNIEKHRGRLVKTTGDGFLAEFASVVDAFRCAEAVQDGIEQQNEGTASDDRIEVRMGINVGEIIFDDGDVFGDGVNIAARLESLAEPGGICVSARAWEDLRKLQIDFDDLGEQKLKNIAQPVRAYSLSRLDRIARRRSVFARLRPKKLAVVAAAWAAMASIGWAGYFVTHQTDDSPLNFVTSAIDKMPCSWLRVSESSRVDGRNMFKLVGASLSPPKAISENIVRAGANANIPIREIDTAKVAPLFAQQCAWVETLKPFRYQGMNRVSVEVLRHSAGTEPDYELKFRFDLRDLKKVVQIYGVESDGNFQYLVGSTDLVAGRNGITQLPDGRYELHIHADMTGWSGMVFSESDKPMPRELLTKAISSSESLSRFSEAARAEGWRFELLWFYIGTKQPNADDQASI